MRGTLRFELLLAGPRFESTLALCRELERMTIDPLTAKAA
jgi:hypothetical protein